MRPLHRYLLPLAAAMVLAAPALQARPVHLAVKTNLLYDACVLPNAGAEVQWGAGRWSAGVNGGCIWLRNYRHWRHWRIEGGDVYLRRWLGPGNAPFTGHHVGAYAQMYTMQVQLNDRRGFISGTPGHGLGSRPGWGAGLEYGYTFGLGRHLRLDLTLGLGYYRSTFREYTPGNDPCGGCQGRYTYLHTHHVNWVGPTKAEVALSWTFGAAPSKEGGEP